MATEPGTEQALKRKKIITLAGLALFVIFLISRFSSISLPSTRVTDLSQARLIMFSTTTCHYCRKARRFFAEHNIPYFEYNIDESEANRKKFIALNGRGTPLILIGQQRIDGYDPNKLLEALSKSDKPK